MPLLEIQNLSTQFRTHGRTVKAVDNVSLSIDRGEIMALVGESGCGKSVTAFSILGLIPEPPGRIVGGRILFEGRDLRSMSPAELRQVRGGSIGMIFQDPMTSLNPALTVGEQIAEVVMEHRGVSRKVAMERAAELLERVKVPDVQRRIKEYPHRLSGGMRQRVMIAMALACEPKLLIADEPTTALDVTIQAQILRLLCEIRDRTGTAILLITHDFGVVAEVADRVAVMYAGRKVEEGPVAEIFANPQHPYTRGLLGSIPQEADDTGARSPLQEIPGMVPPLDQLPPGCAFAPRCGQALHACAGQIPVLEPLGHSQVACLVAQAQVHSGRCDTTLRMST
jgi:oligopeptide/dipeptide ABC transporter ATP-binding protein